MNSPNQSGNTALFWSNYFIVKCNKTGSDLYRVVGRNENSKRIYKFECQVTRDFPMLLTNDNQFLAILAVEPKNKRECVSVYNARRGVYVFRILIK